MESWNTLVTTSKYDRFEYKTLDLKRFANIFWLNLTYFTCVPKKT